LLTIISLGLTGKRQIVFWKLDLQTKAKKRLQVVLCYTLGLCVFLFLAGVVFLRLLTHRPKNYEPLAPIQDRQVSQYLTHELATSFYNNLHRGKPFDLVIEQAGINDIIARGKWPQHVNGLLFSAPAVVFVPDNVLLMGIVAVEGIEVVVTIVLRPEFDQSGRLRLQVASIRAGALNITVFAKRLAAEIFRQQASEIQTNQLLSKTLSALVVDEPFKPVLEIEGRKVHIEGIAVASGALTIRFAPAT